MTDREKLAIGFFRRGIGCAQAIMCAYAKELSISHEEALGLLKNVAAVLRGEAEPVVKKEETLNVTAIIEAFYASAEQKKEINCAEIINK